MYAVVRTGGKQYRVQEGDLIQVERLLGEEGVEVSFSDVLLVEKGDKVTVGAPLVSGASVSGQIVRQLRGPKLICYKKIRRHGKRWKKGHRQELTQVLVKEIRA